MDEAAIRRYAEIQVPRYTSYPTAVDFSNAIGPKDYASWLSRLQPGEPVSLYIHVPYCRALCHYCGCHAKLVRRDEIIADYARLLKTEIGLVGQHVSASPTAARLHWGGGTPSILETDGMASVLEALLDVFTFDPAIEHAIELDPRNVTPAFAHELALLGVTRVSFGVQDFDPSVQQAIGRVQPFDLVAASVRNIRQAGISSLSFDLMYGLPHQTIDSATRTAEQAITLQPDRISVFGYAHLPNRRKNQRLIDAAALPDANARYRQSEAIADTFISAGCVAIGIDHFALPEDSLAIAVAEGRLRRNFQGYTDDPCEVLIGFGSSAISHLRDGYVQNLADNSAYARAVASGELASARGHRFSDEDRRRGDIIGELMCRHEVNLDSYGGGDGFYDEITRLEPLRTDGFLDIDGARIQLTPQGRPFVRLVAAAFDEYLPAHQTGFSVAV